MECSHSGFICLHIGAGYHSEFKDKLYKELCKEACSLGINLLKQKQSSVDIVESVCCFLENSDLTNAGYGSNLCQDGNVECEAAIMDSATSHYAAVSCVSRLKNPIKLSRKLLREQSNTYESGLCPPMILCGDGAHKKACEYGLPLIDNVSLKTGVTIKNHKRYEELIKKLSRKRPNSNNDSISCFKKVSPVRSNYFIGNIIDESSVGIINSICPKKGLREVGTSDVLQYSNDDLNNMCRSDDNLNSTHDSDYDLKHMLGQNDDLNNKQDTIGVICIDIYGNTATAVSSGGIAYKTPGRIGHVSQYGAACWSFKYSSTTTVACCTSGCGELLTQTNLAKKTAEHIQGSEFTDLSYFLHHNFIKSPYLNSTQNRLCGLLAVKLFHDSQTVFVDFNLAHTTDSFVVGFSSGCMSKPSCVISRLDKAKVGKTSVTQGFSVVL